MTALRDSHSSPTPNCAHQAYAVLPPSMPAPVPAPTNENGLAYDVTAGNLDRLRAFLVDARRAGGVEEAQLAEGVGTVAPSWLLANPAHSMRRNRADLVPRPTRTLRAGPLGALLQQRRDSHTAAPPAYKGARAGRRPDRLTQVAAPPTRTTPWPRRDPGDRPSVSRWRVSQGSGAAVRRRRVHYPDKTS